MDFLNFVMALSPIIVVLVGILGFRQSAKRVAPVALVWTLVLAFTFFNVAGATFKENVAVYDALLWKGIKEGLKIVLMVFGAFVILNLLRETGAIDEVKGAIARISEDRRVQVTMGSLLVVSYIMQSPSTGMMDLLASDIAAVVGRFYPAAAVLIGASGSFITGTGLGSNIMFADMHIQAAQALGMNPITVFAGQNAGASLGNLICPNNTVAACATVDQIGNENKVMKRTLPAFAVILVLYMALTMLYTCVLFPSFGV